MEAIVLEMIVMYCLTVSMFHIINCGNLVSFLLVDYNGITFRTNVDSARKCHMSHF